MKTFKKLDKKALKEIKGGATQIVIEDNLIMRSEIVIEDDIIGRPQIVIEDQVIG